MSALEEHESTAPAYILHSLSLPRQHVGAYKTTVRFCFEVGNTSSLSVLLRAENHSKNTVQDIDPEYSLRFLVHYVAHRRNWPLWNRAWDHRLRPESDTR